MRADCTGELSRHCEAVVQIDSVRSTSRTRGGNRMPIALSVMLALALVLAGGAAPAQAFTAADFKGWYAFGFEGLENGNRVVSTGVMRLDGVGAVTGRWSMRRDGGG